MKHAISRMPDPVLMGIVLVTAFIVILYYAIISIIDIIRPIIVEILNTGFARMLYTLP